MRTHFVTPNDYKFNVPHGSDFYAEHFAIIAAEYNQLLIYAEVALMNKRLELLQCMLDAHPSPEMIRHLKFTDNWSLNSLQKSRLNKNYKKIIEDMRLAAKIINENREELKLYAANQQTDSKPPIKQDD